VQVWGRDVCDDGTYLYLEHALPFSRWPWSDTALAARVCRELARLHDSAGLPRETFAWDYENELIRSAEDTVEMALAARDVTGRRIWGRLGDFRRVVKALPEIRRRLLRQGTTVIHGDMHPGNVILRRANHGLEVVLIDWARARVGSPLEDVASWLHSLGWLGTRGAASSRHADARLP
jgi:aminoglycoside phosphotransferase (APT) family kinase protein